jgi:hypothetical protein
VCSECNAWANREIDQPLTRDPYIASERVRLGVGHRDVPARLSRGPVTFTVDEPDFPVPVEHRLLAYETPHGLEFEQTPAITRTETGIRVVAGDEETLDALMERVRAPLVAEGRVFTEKRKADVVQATVKVPRRGDGGAGYERMVAKVALATAPALLGEGWLDSPTAKLVRQAMRAATAEERAAISLSYLGYPCQATVQGAFSAPDLHVIALAPGEGHTGLAVALFGRLLGVIQVLPYELPLAEHRVVLVDPVRGNAAGAALADFIPYRKASETSVTPGVTPEPAK